MKPYFLIAILAVLMACNSSENKSTDNKDTTSTNAVESVNVQPTFTDKQVARIYADYIVLKDALVATKQDDAKVAAQTLSESLSQYAGCEHTALTATKIKNAKDIAAQRNEFTSLSNDVIALFKNASIEGGTIYVQRCPMANKGEGGEWLASEKQIRNPYYGDEMMECGAVLEEIKAK
ncbi:MAG: DUF3347 domain-containing protein [Pedobacter sp.]|nr:MAG: DUF3347 domain-containing protein [Pedobacter sp.]